MMMKCPTSGTGLISFGIQDSCCALSGTALWHWLGMLDQLPPVPPMPPPRRDLSSQGTRRTTQTAFMCSQLFGLWEGGIFNGDVLWSTTSHCWKGCLRFLGLVIWSNITYVFHQKDLPFADVRCCTARWHLGQEPQDSDQCCWLSHASHCYPGLSLISFSVRFIQEMFPTRNSPSRMSVRKHIISNSFCHPKWSVILSQTGHRECVEESSGSQ